MKKLIILPIILFVAFLSIDIGLIAVYESTHRLDILVAAVFLEIAIFGSAIIGIVLYGITKINKITKQENNDEQITDDSDKNLN